MRLLVWVLISDHAASSRYHEQQPMWDRQAPTAAGKTGKAFWTVGGDLYDGITDCYWRGEGKYQDTLLTRISFVYNLVIYGDFLSDWHSFGTNLFCLHVVWFMGGELYDGITSCSWRAEGRNEDTLLAQSLLSISFLIYGWRFISLHDETFLWALHFRSTPRQCLCRQTNLIPVHVLLRILPPLACSFIPFSAKEVIFIGAFVSMINQNQVYGTVMLENWTN